MKSELITPSANTSACASACRKGSCKHLSTAVLVMILGLALLPVQAQTFTVLHSLTAAEGASPQAGLVRDSAGNLYGTAFSGGIFQNCDNELGGGTLFKVDPSGALTVLHAFNNIGDGCFPTGILLNATGNLYGSAYNNNVFRLTDADEFTVAYNFLSSAQGSQPYGPLLMDDQGNIYGTTLGGGSLNCGLGGCGTVFKIDSTGRETALYRFTGEADGSDPEGGVIRDAAGNLYGTTAIGGDHSCSYLFSQPGCGTVFKLSPDGILTVLHTFTGVDGKNPRSGLTMDAAGNLYSVTVGGGNLSCNPPNGCGTVFRIDPSGTETVLRAFGSPADGRYPMGTPALDEAGNLYGTTVLDNTNTGYGAVFKLDPHGKYTVLHRFRGQDGAGPAGGVIFDSTGNLYGTTTTGGTTNAGVIFKLTP
jgi:uncharacterized repeat protein (TIGR03803 family)